jgi:Polyketide cyclase / dehydrase and lipid transport
MRIRTTTVLAMALFIISAACNAHRSDQRMPAAAAKDTLSSVVNAATIEGPPEAVFDLVTTARFWPQWHPATTVVSGVTERPYLLGDRIIEQGRIGQGNFEVTWNVAEHVRPRRVVLQSELSPVQIIYSFNSRENITEYTRELNYNVEDLKSISPDPNEVNRLMQLQSEEAVKQLKALVEKVLRAERIQTR